MDYSVLAEVTVRHGSWVAYLPPQSQLLAAILVMERGKPVTRASLARTLWDEEDDSPKSPDSAVTRAVHDLRKSLQRGPISGDPLPSIGTTYYLKLSEDEADVLRFRAKIRAAHRSTGSEATRLMRAALHEWGPGAAGLFGGSPFTGLRGRWAETNRETLRTEYRDACLHLLRQDFADHEFERLAAECRGLASEPAAWCDERFIELWMVATYRAGNRTQAEWIYQTAMDSAITHLSGPLSGRVSRLAEYIRTEDPRLLGPSDFLETELLQRNSSTEGKPMSDIHTESMEVPATPRNLPGDDLPPRPAAHLAREEAELGQSAPADSGSATTEDPASDEGQPAAAGGTSLVFNGRVIAPGAVFGTQVNDYGRPR